MEIAGAFAPGGDHLVTTTSGDVELAVEGGVTIDVRTVSGDVGRDHPDLREHTSRRDPLVIGNGAARLAVRTLSGDIEVRAGRDRSQRVAGAAPPSGFAPGAPVGPIAPAQPPRQPRTSRPARSDPTWPWIRPPRSPSSRHWHVARSVWPKPSVAWARRSTTVADPFGDILRLVAEGRLTPAEAAPILDALAARERPAHEPGTSGTPASGTRAGTAGAGPGPGPATGAPSRIRVQVRENGRVVVDLQVPGVLAGLASSLPGIPTGYADRVREALRTGLRGPIVDIRDKDGSGLSITID